MTKTLTLDEMLDCLEMMGDPSAPMIARQLEAVGDLMASKIAAALNVECGDTRREQSAFAGTCATFWPSAPFQPCPEPLAFFDSSEWDESEDRLAELRADRDAWVIGAPDGTETPDPDGWERDNPDDAAELASLEARVTRKEPMRIHIVTAEHFNVPGLVLKAFATAEAANAEATELVNIMVNDSDMEADGDEPGDWQAWLARLQDYHGAAHCYVEITETELEG